MKTAQKYISLCCVMMMVGAIAMPSYGAISFSSSKKLQPKKFAVTQYLDASNPDLRRALEIHNLMNEMPDLADVIHTADDLDKQKGVLSKQMEAMTACNAGKLGDVFKNPKKAWGKMVDAYEQKRQTSSEEKGELSFGKSRKDLVDAKKKNMLISRNIMMDVYKNPQKWEETNSGASFPLWGDQAVVFEKQWDDFYNKMNAAFGVPLSGRPQVDEKTRQDAQKYGTVLKAHQAYLSSLQSKKNIAYKDLPPKAPAPLPKPSEIMYIDPETKQVYPEMPDVWKDEATRQAIIKANPNGELAQTFKSGNTDMPVQTGGKTSDLEKEYTMRVAFDSVEKGHVSVTGTTDKMQQEFIKKLSSVGIDMPNLNLANKGQYLKVQKQLKEEKKKAIASAEKYIALLEKQDAEHPELVKRRQDIQNRKQARLSEKAQQALAQSDAIVQISQMSPVMQQKMVISALEKDKDALVRLTETNAMDVDQMIRERQATNKIITESQKQMEGVYQEQIKNMPALTNCAVF